MNRHAIDLDAVLSELPPPDRDRYLGALQHALTVSEEKDALRERFERVRGDTRVETQIWRLTEFDRYLDRLRDSYCETSDLLGLSIAPADVWPLLDFDALEKGDEVRSLVLLVTLKHERIQSMPLASVLDSLLLNGSRLVH